MPKPPSPDAAPKTLFLRNALTESLEAFVPSDPHDVKIYCCGPTVYDAPHLGHARTYVFLDVLRRILRHHLGYGVRSVVNITDLDSKIIEKGGPSVARRYEDSFFEAMDALNVERPDFAPRVSEHLLSALRFADRCRVSGHAYRDAGSDTVYFDAAAYSKKWDRVFPKTKKRDGRPVEREGEGTKDERDPRDFALWKADKKWTDEKGEERTGLPGWHTECASIADFHFRDAVDLHLGGIDLQFPHHENEIALLRVLRDAGTPRVRFCLYAGHLEIEGKKMSKSLKNFTTVEEILAEGHSPLAVRYMFLKRPYGKRMGFCREELKRAQKSHDRFVLDVNRMRTLSLRIESDASKEDPSKRTDARAFSHGIRRLNDCKKRIDDHLMNDLNVPSAVETLEEYVRPFGAGNHRDPNRDSVAYCLKYVEWMAGTCLGLLPKEKERANRSDELYPVLDEFRSSVRSWVRGTDRDETKLLSFCDDAREEMKRMGYVVEDDATIKI